MFRQSVCHSTQNNTTKESAASEGLPLGFPFVILTGCHLHAHRFSSCLSTLHYLNWNFPYTYCVYWSIETSLHISQHKTITYLNSNYRVFFFFFAVQMFFVWISRASWNLVVMSIQCLLSRRHLWLTGSCLAFCFQCLWGLTWWLSNLLKSLLHQIIFVKLRQHPYLQMYDSCHNNQLKMSLLFTLVLKVCLPFFSLYKAFIVDMKIATVLPAKSNWQEAPIAA